MTMWFEELVIVDNGANQIDWRNPSEISEYIPPSKKIETQES
jgi:hypothetical protein